MHGIVFKEKVKNLYVEFFSGSIKRELPQNFTDDT